MIPSLPGQEEFKGLLMHSHNYRHPEVFRDMNVLCLGAGPSGIDIALEIAPFAKQVTCPPSRFILVKLYCYKSRNIPMMVSIQLVLFLILIIPKTKCQL